MKIKDLETAKKYGFKLLISESDLINEAAAWRDDFTPEELEEFKKISEKNKKLMQENIVVPEYSCLSGFEGDYGVDIGHSRRGQHYYILCNPDTLVLSVFATKPDGSGSNRVLPDWLFEMIKNGDVSL